MFFWTESGVLVGAGPEQKPAVRRSSGGGLAPPGLHLPKELLITMVTIVRTGTIGTLYPVATRRNVVVCALEERQTRCPWKPSRTLHCHGNERLQKECCGDGLTSMGLYSTDVCNIKRKHVNIHYSYKGKKRKLVFYMIAWVNNCTFLLVTFDKMTSDFIQCFPGQI